jgi:hypothetical protein
VAAQHAPHAVCRDQDPAPVWGVQARPRSGRGHAPDGPSCRRRSAARPSRRAGWASAALAAPAGAASPTRAGRLCASTRRRSIGAPQTPRRHASRSWCAQRGRTTASYSRTKRHDPSCGSRPFRSPGRPRKRQPRAGRRRLPNGRRRPAQPSIRPSRSVGRSWRETTLAPAESGEQTPTDRVRTFESCRAHEGTTTGRQEVGGSWGSC